MTPGLSRPYLHPGTDEALPPAVGATNGEMMDDETGVDAIEAAIKVADQKADELRDALVKVHQLWNNERMRIQRVYEVIEDAQAAQK